MFVKIHVTFYVIRHILDKRYFLTENIQEWKERWFVKMEGNLHIRCPKDVDINLFTRLFSGLVAGDDLDDLIFNGEEWYKSER